MPAGGMQQGGWGQPIAMDQWKVLPDLPRPLAWAHLCACRGGKHGRNCFSHGACLLHFDCHFHRSPRELRSSRPAPTGFLPTRFPTRAAINCSSFLRAVDGRKGVLKITRFYHAM